MPLKKDGDEIVVLTRDILRSANTTLLSGVVLKEQKKFAL